MPELIWQRRVTLHITSDRYMSLEEVEVKPPTLSEVISDLCVYVVCIELAIRFASPSTPPLAAAYLSFKRFTLFLDSLGCLPRLVLIALCLSRRFLVNATKDDYTEQRILLVIEIAHWYYLDYFQKEYPDLKPMNFATFARRMFDEYPPLHSFVPKFQVMLSAMKDYKRNIPVCGGVILNPQMNRVLLVRGVKSSDSFSFPRGKINSGESPLACAAREIYEEAGLKVDHLLNEKDCVAQDLRKSPMGQFVTLFFVVVDEVGMTTKPTVLNEIGAIQWHSISKLIQEGSRAYLVPNFIHQIETWAKKRKGASYTPAATHGRVVYDMKNPNAANEDPKPTDPSTITSFYFDRSKLSSCFLPSTSSSSSAPPAASSSTDLN